MGHRLLVAVALLAMASLTRAQIGGPGPGQCKGFRLLKDGTLAACVETVDSTGADFVWTCAAQKCGFALNTNVSHFGSCLDATKICATGGTYTGSLTFGSGGSLTFASGSTLALATGTATLNGETLLPPSNFLLLAGRSGGGNDFTLSTSSNGTITGSSATGRSLNIFGNAFGNATSVVNVNGRLKLLMSAAVAQPQLSFQSANGANFNVNLISPTVGADSTYTLPAAVPTVTGQPLVATTGGVMSWLPGTVQANAFCVGDGATDDTTAWNALVAGAGSGKTIRVPTGTIILLSSAPTALPSGTTVICDDPSAGFKLATKTCVGGIFQGDYCTADADCPSSTCTTTAAYAPTGATTYPVFTAAASSTNVRMTGCTIKAGGLGVHLTCVGGSRIGKTCTTSDNDATHGCPTGSTCTAPSLAIAGPGSIDPVDLSNSTYAVIDGVQLEDHTKGNLAFKVASYGLVQNTTNKLANTSDAAHTSVTYAVQDGIVIPAASVGTRVVRNEVRGSRYVVRVGGSNSFFSDNHLTQGNTADTAVAFWLDGTGAAAVAQNLIEENFIDTVYWGLRGSGIFTDNVSYIGNRHLGGDGPKVLINGAGWKIQNNYLAWGAATTVIGLNDNTSGATVTAPIHPQITGNLTYTPASSSHIRVFDVGKRCITGARAQLLCTTDDTNGTTGCGAGATCPGCCTTGLTVNGVSQVLIQGNTFYNANVGINLTALTSAANTPISDVAVLGNHFSGDTFGIRYPASTGNITLVTVKGNDFTNATTPQSNWVPTFGDLADFFNETEIDFGATPTYGATFTVTDARVSASTLIMAHQSGNAPTGRQADENEFDKLVFAALPGAGSFTLYATSATGLVSGKYKVAYEVR